jgi:hypothetical protein
MPGSTPNRQLPYPLPTDQVSAGASDIRALAEAVDVELATIQYGTTYVQMVNGQARVDFPRPYSAPPTVVVTPAVSKGSQIAVELVDANGFNVGWLNEGSTATNLHWIAIGR